MNLVFPRTHVSLAQSVLETIDISYTLDSASVYQKVKQKISAVSSYNNTQQKTHNLFWPDENSIEQCFAAHIVQGC